MDVDGFRADAPSEVPFWFWRLWREKVKRIKPDAYLVGELRGHAPDWIGPEYFDATVNYAYFRDPVTSWIGQGQGDAAGFERDMAPGRSAYPSQAVRDLMNIVDNHDTVRFVTLAGGDRRRLQLAALLAMTYVGAPHIWYGDEIGMEGEKEPDNRRPFTWSYAQDPGRVALRDYYKKLTAARREHGALRHGSFRLIAAEGQTYAFLRADNHEQLIVVIHNSKSPGRVDLDLAALGAPDGTEFRYLVGGADPTGKARVTVAGGKLSLDMGPLAGALLIGE
jgi:glycosidase